MFQRVRNLEELKSHCTKIVKEHASLLAKFDEARAKDTLRHFLSSNAAYLQVLTVHASEAARIIDFIDREAEEKGVAMSDERKFELVKEDAERRLINLNTRITSRSTSLSANLDEDADRTFTIELYQAFNGGY